MGRGSESERDRENRRGDQRARLPDVHLTDSLLDDDVIPAATTATSIIDENDNTHPSSRKRVRPGDKADDNSTTSPYLMLGADRQPLAEPSGSNDSAERQSLRFGHVGRPMFLLSSSPSSAVLDSNTSMVVLVPTSFDSVAPPSPRKSSVAALWETDPASPTEPQEPTSQGLAAAPTRDRPQHPQHRLLGIGHGSGLGGVVGEGMKKPKVVWEENKESPRRSSVEKAGKPRKPRKASTIEQDDDEGDPRKTYMDSATNTYFNKCILPSDATRPPGRNAALRRIQALIPGAAGPPPAAVPRYSGDNLTLLEDSSSEEVEDEHTNHYTW